MDGWHTQHDDGVGSWCSLVRSQWTGCLHRGSMDSNAGTAAGQPQDARSEPFYGTEYSKHEIQEVSFDRSKEPQPSKLLYTLSVFHATGT